MRALDKRLQDEGYQTLRIGYPSTHAPIATLVEGLKPQLPKQGSVHFVGHSLGGILAKHLMAQLPEARQGRIVQLSSPNCGSALAKRMQPFAFILGPSLTELTPQDCKDDKLNIGAIAGTAAPAFFGFLTGISDENDGKVSVISAWGNAAEGQRIKLPVSHSTMMFNAEVIDATVQFLQHGAFSNPGPNDQS